MSVRGNGQRFKVMGFSGADHGSLALSQTLSLGWPVISYPTNASEEAQTLEAVTNGLREARQAGNPCAAIVIEPTNASTGHSVSDNFLAQLKATASTNEAALIIDESNTGCGASGNGFW